MSNPPLPKGVFRLSDPPPVDAPEFPFGLAAKGVHEVCEAAYGDMPAICALVASLAATGDGPVLWVSCGRARREHGRLFETGLAQVAPAFRPLVHVDAEKSTDALWAIEEAAASRALGLVIGEVQDMDFTASRRLSLVSERVGTPIVLLFPYMRAQASAANVRWRISAAPSGPNAFDPAAPGATRWRAVLERAREVPTFAGRVFDIELNDETLSLRVVPELAPDAVAPGAVENRPRALRA